MSILQSYQVFNSVNRIGESYLINQLEENFKAYLDWGFLNIGGFVNVTIPTSGLYGGTFHQLKTVDTPGYTLGQVWQTPKKDWIWESGFYYNDNYNDNNTVINISGIYINDNFIPGPTGSGIYGYYFNYPLGQVVFNRAIPQTSKVNMEYSYRWCQIYKSSTQQDWQELQQLTYKPAPQIDLKNKGDYSLLSNHRIQLPAIVIEPIARSYSQPWQLGRHDFLVYQDILLHIFTENAIDKNRIADIIRLQKQMTIQMYDINKVVNSGVNPLDYRGSINKNGLIYPFLANQTGIYAWHNCWLKDINIIDMENKNKNLYWCTLRITSETIL